MKLWQLGKELPSRHYSPCLPHSRVANQYRVQVWIESVRGAYPYLLLQRCGDCRDSGPLTKDGRAFEIDGELDKSFDPRAALPADAAVYPQASRL